MCKYKDWLQFACMVKEHGWLVSWLVGWLVGWLGFNSAFNTI